VIDMQPWHEDDSFWAIWAPDMFSEKAHLRVAAEVEGILALARPAEAPASSTCAAAPDASRCRWRASVTA
jgi:hypothetical protein